jgi:hypothetical protein
MEQRTFCLFPKQSTKRSVKPIRRIESVTWTTGNGQVHDANHHHMEGAPRKATFGQKVTKKQVSQKKATKKKARKKKGLEKKAAKKKAPKKKGAKKTTK